MWCEDTSLPGDGAKGTHIYSLAEQRYPALHSQFISFLKVLFLWILGDQLEMMFHLFFFFPLVDLINPILA